jgi:MFS family permease
MMTLINLTEIEKKAIVAVFFIDVRHGWVFALGITLAICVPEFLRRQLVHPRIGYARFPQSKGMGRHVAAICLAVICLLLFYCLGKIERFNWLMPLYLGTMFSAAALVAAIKSGLSLYYALAFVLLLHDDGWVVAFQLWGLAAVLILAGLAQLIGFFREHPKRAEEKYDESA